MTDGKTYKIDIAQGNIYRQGVLVRCREDQGLLWLHEVGGARMNWVLGSKVSEDPVVENIMEVTEEC